MQTIPTTERRPPADVEAERNVLGCLFLSPLTVAKVAQRLTGAMFMDRDLGQLFDAVVTLDDARLWKADVSLQLVELRKLNLPPAVTTASFVAEIATAVPTAANAEFYAAIVRRCYELRCVLHAATEAARATHERDADVLAIIGTLESRLQSVGITQPREARPMRIIIDEAWEEIAADAAATKRGGVFTGIPKFDATFGAWQPGELVIYAARPGRGKTALAMQTALASAKHGGTLFVSLEMRDRELVLRALCAEAGVNSRDLRLSQPSADAVTKLFNARDAFGEDCPRIYDQPGATLTQIRNMSRLVKAQHGLRLLIVDYVGLVTPPDKGKQRYEQIGDITAGLKTLSKELSIVVIALAQLRRDQGNARPDLSMLRESGNIEQDADAVVFVHWPDQSKDNEQDVELIVAKHRHGEAGFVKSVFLKQSTTFVDEIVSRRENYTPQFDGYNNGDEF